MQIVERAVEVETMRPDYKLDLTVDTDAVAGSVDEQDEADDGGDEDPAEVSEDGQSWRPLVPMMRKRMTKKKLPKV